MLFANKIMIDNGCGIITIAQDDQETFYEKTIKYYIFKEKKMNIDIKKVKIFVTIPLENVEEVRDAICNAGAGIIGNYTYCTSSTKFIGTFRPNDSANPYIGEKNNLEFVEEEKLEVVCDVDNVKRVITKLREIHPYEEPAIDIVPLIDEEIFK